MIARRLRAGGRVPPVPRSVRWVLLPLLLAGAFPHPPGVAGEVLRNAGLFVVPREILFFSAQAGSWTSVRLDAGERILQRGVDGNVAAVVTSQRAIGFSAVLNATHEIRVTEDEAVEAFKAEGNVATLLTKRRAIGFSAATGKWTDVERFQPR